MEVTKGKKQPAMCLFLCMSCSKYHINICVMHFTPYYMRETFSYIQIHSYVFSGVRHVVCLKWPNCSSYCTKYFEVLYFYSLHISIVWSSFMNNLLFHSMLVSQDLPSMNILAFNMINQPFLCSGTLIWEQVVITLSNIWCNHLPEGLHKNGKRCGKKWLLSCETLCVRHWMT